MLVADLRRDLVEVCRTIYLRGLVSATGGNLSVKLGADSFLITRSGSSFKDLSDKDVLTINKDGLVVEGSGQPSTETPIHLALYKIRVDIGSVIHAHPPYATAFAAAGRPVPPVTVQASELLGEVRMIRYAHPGSETLTKLCAEAFKEDAVRCALLQSHGVLVVGQNLEEAYNTLDLLEETAKIAYLVSVLKRGLRSLKQCK